MTDAPADVNWLLSALAQASAALIAIVGGLHVSRYVALHAEQQAARRRVEDLTRREKEAEARHTAARKDLDLYYVDDLLESDDVFEVIFAKEFEATVADALAAADDDGDDLNQDLLASRLKELSNELHVALQQLYQLVPIAEDQPSWSDFRRVHEPTIGHRAAWEWMYDKVCEARGEEARKAESERRKKSPLGSLVGYDSSALLRNIALGNPQLSGLRNVVSSQHEIAHIASLRGRAEQAEAEVRAVQQERRLASETYEATRQPEGFGLALQVLSLLAILGMAVPVIIMGFSPVTLPPWARAVVIGGFLIGVGLLLRFLFVYASFLREGGREALPKTVLGLARR